MPHETRNSNQENLPGHYANCFQVGHNAFEFLLDFGQFSPEGNTPAFHTRIIVAPASARRFAAVLEEALRRHQQEFGETSSPH